MFYTRNILCWKNCEFHIKEDKSTLWNLQGYANVPHLQFDNWLNRKGFRFTFKIVNQGSAPEHGLTIVHQIAKAKIAEGVKWACSGLGLRVPGNRMSCPMGERRVNVNKRCAAAERCGEEDITVLEENPVLVVPVSDPEPKPKINLAATVKPKSTGSSKRWDHLSVVLRFYRCANVDWMFLK